MLTIVLAVILGLFAALLGASVAKGPSLGKQVEQRLGLIAAEITPDASGAASVRKEELLSGIPWLNQVLSQLDLASRARLLLYQAEVSWSVGMLLTISFAGWLGAAGLLYLRIGAMLPALALGAIFVPLPTLYVLRCRTKRLRRFEQLLPEGLTLLVSALRVGHSFMTALGYLGQEGSEPLAGEFRKCFEEQNYGIDPRTAMLNLATRVPLQDIRIFVAAVLIHKESGGNLAEVLERVAQTIRERFRLKKQVRIHTAQGRATGWILSLLPVILGAAMYLVHPEGISLLWTRAVGQKLLYTAAGMNILGGLLIRKIVRVRV
ncbi:MAG TPA: type II secretion system F family protein [Bryobacteraceae bacterium]|nr:type II secretion system F family protein [Bryobacteraceae bacterium]